MSPKGGDAVSHTQRLETILERLPEILKLPIDVHAENILDTILGKTPKKNKPKAEFERTRMLELLADQGDIEFYIKSIEEDNRRIIQARRTRGPDWKYENIRRVPENAVNLILKVILVRLGQQGLRDPRKIAELAITAAETRHQDS